MELIFIRCPEVGISPIKPTTRTFSVLRDIGSVASFVLYITRTRKWTMSNILTARVSVKEHNISGGLEKG
jgi:hypothetical protein